jgi:hypothetical protein
MSKGVDGVHTHVRTTPNSRHRRPIRQWVRHSLSNDSFHSIRFLVHPAALAGLLRHLNMRV